MVSKIQMSIIEKKTTHFLNLKKICWMMILDIKTQDFHINISIY